MFRRIAIGVYIWIWVIGVNTQAQKLNMLPPDGCGAKHLPISNIRYARLAPNPTMEDKEDSLLILPVIVHIVHHGENVGAGDNLAASHTNSQIEVLNQDFRRIANTAGGNNNPLSADSFIGFVRAAQNPEGNRLPELGINRVDGSAVSWPAPPYSRNFIETRIKPATQWDPTQYINIWVLDVEGALKGMAQFPDSSGLSNLGADQEGTATTDGLYVDTEQWGERSLSFGRIATHEMGHFLGLIHTWGEGGCDTDDGCDDTPPAARETIGCPPSSESCGSLDMTENYMDGTGGLCQSVFTKCQIERMRQVLMRSPRRRELAASQVGKIPLNVSNETHLRDIISLQDPTVDRRLKQVELKASFPRPMELTLTLHSLQGSTIKSLFNGSISTGEKAIGFSYNFLPGGIYLILWELEGVRIPQKLFIP
ncbi:MAG: M43 family zinc metalloprotease [Bacteroidota bacterium]